MPHGKLDYAKWAIMATCPSEDGRKKAEEYD